MRRTFAAFVAVAWLFGASSLMPVAEGGQANTALASAGEPDTDEREFGSDEATRLTERVDHLQRDVRALQQAVEALQATPAVRQPTRSPDVWHYGLTALVALLVASIGLIWRRQLRWKGERSWTKEARTLTRQGMRAVKTPHRSSAPLPAEALDDLSSDLIQGISEPRAAADLSTVAPSGMHKPGQPSASPVKGRRHELSPGELIDLEQQADFFVALGQEELAIDLLMSHVRSSGGTSPMPYLKLLDIYRRRSEVEAYERIRERFNRRFNGRAPAWSGDSAPGRALETYPDVLASVQSVWADPERAGGLLEALLFRGDASREPFELPAYEELLFLYALARDLAARVRERLGVDLLLPLDVSDAPPAILVAQASGSGARRGDAPVDLELDFDVGKPPISS